MLIKLCHANNGNLIEEFSITKFEDLENKIYGFETIDNTAKINFVKEAKENA